MSVQQRPGRIENLITYELLCDDNGSFIRIYTRNSSGTLINLEEFDLDGSTPYVVSGQVYKCDNLRLEVQTLCDDNGSFFRLFLYDSATGALQNIYDYDLNNNPYVVVGTVIVCETLEYVSNVLCDDDAQFIRRYEYTAGVLTQFLDYDFGGVLYNPNGLVRACESERNHREVLCDDNGQFLRTYLFAPDNTPIGFLDYAIDNLAAYVPQGIIHTCVDINDMFMNMCGYDNVAGETVSYIRRIQFVGLTFGSITDYDLNGSPYNSNPLLYKTWGNCTYETTEIIVCADDVTAIKRTVSVNSVDIDTFIIEDGTLVTPIAWYPGGCGTDRLDVVMCGFQLLGFQFVSFVRRYSFDNNGNITNTVDYDTTGNLYDPSPLANIQYGGCGHLRTEETPYCFLVPGGQESLLDLIKLTFYVDALPVFQIWYDTNYVIQPVPLPLDNLRQGSCLDKQADCNLQMQILQFCDTGNANFVYYEINLFTLDEFNTLNSYEVDAGGSVYVPIGPSIICPGDVSNQYDGTPAEFQNLLNGFFTNLAPAGVLRRCPLGTISVNGKYVLDYPSFNIRQIGVLGTVTEIEVCADGVPAIRRVIGTYEDVYLQEVQFIGTNGVQLTPVSWSPGSCSQLPGVGPSRATISFMFIVDDASINVLSLGTLKEINVLKLGGGSTTIATPNYSEVITSAGNIVYRFTANDGQEYLSDNFTITDTGAGTTRVWGTRLV